MSDESMSSPFEGAMSPADIARQQRDDSEEEEEKWLDAVESGNLHTVDEELKRIRYTLKIIIHANLVNLRSFKVPVTRDKVVKV